MDSIFVTRPSGWFCQFNEENATKPVEPYLLGKNKSLLIKSFTFQLGILLFYRHSFNHTLQGVSFTDVTV